MAKSKNKRKNGKSAKHDIIKRARTQASYDLKDLVVCNIVDKGEITGEDRLIPRTLVFNRRTRKIVGMTTLQQTGLMKQRWNWNIHSGIVCRTQNGKVYLDREQNIFTKTEVFLTELTSYIADTLCDTYMKCNPMHRLTMFWVAAPYDMGQIDVECVLAPMWKFNVLGNLLTEYEQENTNVPVTYYKATTLDEYVEWFSFQDRYLDRLSQKAKVRIKFEVTQDKMKKGQLIELRKNLQDLNLIPDFNPLATPRGFSSKEWCFEVTGQEISKIMSVLTKTPKCLNVYVDSEYEKGAIHKVKLENGGFTEYEG